MFDDIEIIVIALNNRKSSLNIWKLTKCKYKSFTFIWKLWSYSSFVKIVDYIVWEEKEHVQKSKYKHCCFNAIHKLANTHFDQVFHELKNMAIN